MSESEAAAMQHTFVWAWTDEPNGLLCARTFAPDWGIPEDQGNGSGSMQRAMALGRPITVIHGESSVIYAEPVNAQEAAVGGRVRLGETRTISLE